MTAGKLINCIGMIDEKFISEALEYTPERKHGHLAAYLSAAACICIAVTAAIIISGGNDDIETLPEGLLTTISEVREPFQTTYSSPVHTAESEPPQTEKAPDTESSSPVQTAESEPPQTASTESEPPVTETNVTTGEPPAVTDDVTEEVIVPKWEELSEIDRYTELYFRDVRYSLSVNDKFTEDEVEFIQNGEIIGMDEYTGEIKTKACGFYKVKNMSEDYMIAVYTPDGMYTGYSNFGYETETLGEYLKGTDFIGRYDLVTVQSQDMSDSDGKRYYISYEIPDTQGFFEDFLLSHGDALHVSERQSCYESIYVSDGKYSLLRIYDNGYLYLAGMPADRYFVIGEEGVSELAAYLEKNAVAKKVYYNTTDPTDIPE